MNTKIRPVTFMRLSLQIVLAGTFRNRAVALLVVVFAISPPSLEQARAYAPPRLTVLTRVVRAGERARIRLESERRKPGTLHLFVMEDDSEYVNCPVSDPNPDGRSIDLDVYFNTMTGERVFERPGVYAVKAQWIINGSSGERPAEEVQAIVKVRPPLGRDRGAFAALRRGGTPLAAFLGRGGGQGCADASEQRAGLRLAARLARLYPRSSYGRTARAAVRQAARCRRANWKAHPTLVGEQKPLPADVESYPDAEEYMSAPGDRSHTWAYISCDNFADVTSFYRNSLEEHGWSVDDAVWYRQGGAVVAWSEHPRRKIHVSTGIEGCAVTAITISIEELDAPAGATGP